MFIEEYAKEIIIKESFNYWLGRSGDIVNYFKPGNRGIRTEQGFSFEVMQGSLEIPTLRGTWVLKFKDLQTFLEYHKSHIELVY